MTALPTTATYAHPPRLSLERSLVKMGVRQAVGFQAAKVPSKAYWFSHAVSGADG